MIKKDYDSKQEIDKEIYLKKKKIKRVNMEEIDIINVWRKETKTNKRMLKNYREAKNS